jgi:hypothetical protein
MIDGHAGWVLSGDMLSDIDAWLLVQARPVAHWQRG